MRMRSRAWPACVLLVAGCAAGALGARSESVESFVGRHWRTPLRPQGPAPARFTPLEASLAPEACGTCHPAQLADWRTSIHAAAMGPGVAGQLAELRVHDPATALGCQNCHAPLAEQMPLVPGTLADNPAFDAALGARGIPCAACHVRGHERFGPPRRDGSLASAAPRASLPHEGVTRTPAYLASSFCRGCHQFGPDGYALNGKPLEDTYEEWKASRFAAAGVQCQDCHMPDRRHLWRGIHDADMVRGGLTITLDDAPPRVPGGVGSGRACAAKLPGVGRSPQPACGDTPAGVVRTIPSVPRRSISAGLAPNEDNCSDRIRVRIPRASQNYYQEVSGLDRRRTCSNSLFDFSAGADHCRHLEAIDHSARAPLARRR